MLVKCPSCRGQKRIIKLGMMEGDCDKCGGVGHIKKHEEPVEATGKAIVEAIVNDEDDCGGIIILKNDEQSAPKRKRRTKEEMEASRNQENGIENSLGADEQSS